MRRSTEPKIPAATKWSLLSYNHQEFRLLRASETNREVGLAGVEPAAQCLTSGNKLPCPPPEGGLSAGLYLRRSEDTNPLSVGISSPFQAHRV